MEGPDITKLGEGGDRENLFMVMEVPFAHIIRGFIKGWQPGKLTGCQLDHAWLLLLLNQVVFLQESVNINILCLPVKTDYPPVQNINETPALYYNWYEYALLFTAAGFLS